MQIKFLIVGVVLASVALDTEAVALIYDQAWLEEVLYNIEPDDYFPEGEPPYVPHRNRDALTEFRAFFEGSGWTTNQFIEGLVLAVTNNLGLANSGDWAKQRTVNRAMWKLSEINHPAVTNFFRAYIDDEENTPTFAKGAISAMIYYTNLEPDVLSYMRSLCVRTNIYCKAECNVMLDMFETLSTMPDELKPAATNRVAKYMYFAIRHTTKDVTWQDRELANFIPAYSNSIQRLSAMQYVASTIANPRTRALAQQQVDRLSAIPTNQLNDVNWIAE